MTRNAAIERAIAAIDTDAWTPVRYPGAVIDPDTGQWISDAEVAEIPYTAFASTPDVITAAWWCAGSKTPATTTRCSRCGGITRSHQHRPPGRAGRHHPRHHAIIETVFADLIDGPLAHLPSVIWS